MKTKKALGKITCKYAQTPGVQPQVVPSAGRGNFHARGVEADGNYVRTCLLDEFKDRIINSHVYFLDGGFYLPTLGEVVSILSASRVAQMDYSTERFDCDDFAFGVKGEFS